VGETLRAVLDDLADLVPDWMVTQVSPDWCERASHRVENARLPKSESQRTALAHHIGADGLHLLRTLERPDAPAEGKALDRVQILSQVWNQSDEVSGDQATWRAGPWKQEGEGVIRSPDDSEAQTGKKRETTWLGYTVHLTETCGEPAETMRPHVMVHVQTTAAPVPDAEMTIPLQEHLEHAHLKPEEQIVETRYVDAELVVKSSKQGITLVGPTMPDRSWQATAGKGFDLAHVSIEWDKHQATCPQGQQRSRLSQAGERMESVRAAETCARCPVRQDCTRSHTTGRVLHVRPQADHEAFQAR
jgi:transposase